jgi:hypothetical protein
MVFKYQVRWMSEKFIRTALKDYPGVRKQLMLPSIWDKFIDCTHVKVNQLDILGVIKNALALEDFIQNRVIVYVKIHRDKLQGRWTKEDQAKATFKPIEKVGTAQDRDPKNKIWGGGDDAA